MEQNHSYRDSSTRFVLPLKIMSVSHSVSAASPKEKAKSVLLFSLYPNAVHVFSFKFV
jgi:hypothetical protein